jgi:nucleosome assembly protein 1-like 1
MVKEYIADDDEQLLKAIENIYVVDEEGSDNFTIVFDFTPNDLISNHQLTKKYYVHNNNPVKCESSAIEWKEKNLTVKQIKKKQKNKKTGQQRVITKTVQAKSFFTFFKNIEVS